MKKCTKCKEDKSLDEFNKNKTRKDGLQNICKNCSQEKSRNYYQNNVEVQRKIIKTQNKRRKQECRDNINEYLKKNPCIDCGNNNLVVLEFDHKDREQKYKSISQMMASGYSWLKVKKEIDKCEVRCANCHRIKTAKQLGYIGIYGK